MILCGFDWPAGRSKQIAYRDERDHIQELCVKEGECWQERDLTAITGAPKASDMSPLTGCAWSAGGTEQVFYMDRNRHVQELYKGLHSYWQSSDLTALTYAPLVDGTALSAFECRTGESLQVVYVDNNYHVQELHVRPGEQWHATDLTQLTGAPLAEGTHLVGFDWPAGKTKQVAYIDNRGHIVELFAGPTGQWLYADITQLTGAPLADRGNLGPSLTAFSCEADQTKQIVYQDRNGHILQAYVRPNGQWQLTDLTMVTQAPLANCIGGIQGFDWPAGATKQVVYVDNNYHVQELYMPMNNHWHKADLTEMTDAPRVQEGPIAGFAWSAGHTKQVVYTGPRESIQELYVSPGAPWRVADLSLLTSSLMLV
jgi:hypothetical protein